MTRDDYKRARSDSEKAERRLKILDAAEQLIEEAGLDGFTMGAVAELASISKGTLYLYFESKTAVFQALFTRRWAAWSRELSGCVASGMSDSAFCKAFLESAQSDAFLFPRSDETIPVESNPEAFAKVVVAVKESLRPLGQHLEESLKMEPGSGVEMIFGLWALLLGAMRSGPRLQSSSDPENLQNELDRLGVLSCEGIFLRHGPTIVADLRGA